LMEVEIDAVSGDAAAFDAAPHLHFSEIT
jgi:hypothetical protein